MYHTASSSASTPSLFRTGVFLLCLFASPLGQAEDTPLPRQCTERCEVPYGAVVGTTRDATPAYSNCQADCVVFEPNREQGTYSGIKWQCVEYARRWLIHNHGITFGDVDVAADIWKGPNFFTVLDKSPVTPQRYVNGSRQPPRVGDLLIYGREYLGTGHVAVVTTVNLTGGYVRVAEQNFLNQPWPGSYARQLSLVRRKGQVWLLDAYLLGWMRLNTENP